jgi:hypothetical protein
VHGRFLRKARQLGDEVEMAVPGAQQEVVLNDQGAHPEVVGGNRSTLATKLIRSASRMNFTASGTPLQKSM